VRRLATPRTPERPWLVVLAALVPFGVLLAACVGPNPSCAALPTEIELRLSADSLTPGSPQACRGADVTLVIHSQVDGVFHIHGYDDLAPATTVTAGATTDLAFTASRSGQFPIELHPHDDPAGVSVGLLTVHEP
jgi:hypothetical protein